MPSPVNSVGYVITIKEKMDYEIGYIEFYHNIKKKNININSIFVKEEFRKQSFGVFLIYLMFQKIIDLHLDNYITNISLDDDTDFTGTHNSIYYKLGFRNIDPSYPESMKLFFGETHITKKDTCGNNVRIYKNVSSYIKSNTYMIDKIQSNSMNYKNVSIHIEKSFDKKDFVPFESKWSTRSTTSTNLIKSLKPKKTIEKKSKKGGMKEELDYIIEQPCIMWKKIERNVYQVQIHKNPSCSARVEISEFKKKSDIPLIQEDATFIIDIPLNIKERNKIVPIFASNEKKIKKEQKKYLHIFKISNVEYGNSVCMPLKTPHSMKDYSIEPIFPENVNRTIVGLLLGK